MSEIEKVKKELNVMTIIDNNRWATKTLWIKRGILVALVCSLYGKLLHTKLMFYQTYI